MRTILLQAFLACGCFGWPCSVSAFAPRATRLRRGLTVHSSDHRHGRAHRVGSTTGPPSWQSDSRLAGLSLAHIAPTQTHSTAIAGKLMPVLQKFRLGATELRAIGAAVVSVTDWQDVVLLLFLAFGTPAFSKYRNHLARNQELQRFGITKLLSDISKVGLSVYVVDVVMVTLSTLGFAFPQTWKVSTIYTKVAYSLWALRESLYYKRLLLCKLYHVKPQKMGRVEIFNKFINAAVVFVYGLFLMDWLSLELGYALKSIFGLASVFSVAFTLASKDILSNLLAGIWLQGSGRAVAGDSLKFGDGTAGSLIKLGWLETTLRDGEGSIVRVPNNDLAGQKVSNLSQVKKSQVKQILRFDYADADKIPDLIHSIKEEIMRTCKKLVVDGSRPFRVHFTNYMEDHLEVTVVTHHNISPTSGEYHDNRQDLLLAINRAVKRNGMEFAQLVKVEVGRDTAWRIVSARSIAEPSKET